jgi:hypothetical protein
LWRKKTGQYDTIEVGDGFLLLSNMWATTEKTTQEIRLYEDGSYSWGWQRGASGVNDPNYPEVIYGVKPWGQGLDGLALPIQLKNISSLQMELDFDYEVTKETGWWGVIIEFCLTSEKPTLGNDLSGKIVDEVMIYLDWQGDPIEAPAIIESGDYSYTAGYTDDWGSGKWRFTQCRINEKGSIPEEIDLKLFLDYIKSSYSRDGELWLCAVEFGMMYYDQTAGWGLVKKFDLVINGERVSSGRQ